MNNFLVIEELSNQMIDNNVAWKHLKKRLCKVIKNILMPRSIGSTEETIDIAVEDLRLLPEGGGEELVLRIEILDNEEEISFSDMMQLNQLFNGGVGVVSMKSYHLSFKLTLKRNYEHVEQPSAENEDEVEHSEQVQE